MMRIAGIGCCLLDSVYGGFDIESEKIRGLLSRSPGDGGLREGALVFFEDLLEHSGLDQEALNDLLTGGREPVATNLGGPCVVALLHAAQMLEGPAGAEVRYIGVSSDDKPGAEIARILSRTPLRRSLTPVEGGHTPVTMVLAGRGERTFVNRIGAAAKMSPAMVDEGFYGSDIVLCGGTALVPDIHDHLSPILRRARKRGALTVVGTVYDYRNEKRSPHRPWPLVPEGNWSDIDLLVADESEALRISGGRSSEEAASFFKGKVGAFIITRGSKDILAWAGNGRIAPTGRTLRLPVSAYIDDLLAAEPGLRRDTIGCGDNFVGGTLASLAMQMARRPASRPAIEDMVAWGAASGGFAILCDGGAYLEKEKGEKLSRLLPVVEAYRAQIGFRPGN